MDTTTFEQRVQWLEERSKAHGEELEQVRDLKRQVSCGLKGHRIRYARRGDGGARIFCCDGCGAEYFRYDDSLTDAERIAVNTVFSPPRIDPNPPTPAPEEG